MSLLFFVCLNKYVMEEKFFFFYNSHKLNLYISTMKWSKKKNKSVKKLL